MEETSDRSVPPDIAGVTPRPRTFLSRLPGAFRYPFKGFGWGIVVAGAVFFWLAEFVRFVPLVGELLRLALGAYMCGYLINVIGASAGGQDELPEWPELQQWWDDLLRPWLLVAATGVLSLGPLAAFLAWRGPRMHTSDPLFWTAVAWAVLYFPMGLLAVALFDSLGGLNPWVVWRGVAKVGLGYLAAVAVFLLAVVTGFLTSGLIKQFVPLVGTLLGWAVSLYFLLVEMRILGLLYRSYEKRLAWFE